MSYLLSSQVKMYPSAYRDLEHSLDFASFLHSELNITIPKGLSEEYEAFSYEDGSYIVIVIKGYYFKIAKANIPSVNSLYAYIKLVDKSITVGTQGSYTQKMLANITSGEVGSLDVPNGSNYEFRGLAFDTSIPINCIGLAVRDASGNLIYQKLKVHFNEVGDGAGNSLASSIDENATGSKIVKRTSDGDVKARKFVGALDGSVAQATIDTNDRLVFQDASDSLKVKGSTEKFDVSKTNEFLNRKGEFIEIAQPSNETNTTGIYWDYNSKKLYAKLNGGLEIDGGLRVKHDITTGLYINDADELVFNYGNGLEYDDMMIHVKPTNGITVSSNGVGINLSETNGLKFVDEKLKLAIGTGLEEKSNNILALKLKSADEGGYAKVDNNGYVQTYLRKLSSIGCQYLYADTTSSEGDEYVSVHNIKKTAEHYIPFVLARHHINFTFVYETQEEGRVVISTVKGCFEVITHNKTTMTAQTFRDYLTEANANYKGKRILFNGYATKYRQDVLQDSFFVNEFSFAEGENYYKFFGYNSTYTSKTFSFSSGTFTSFSDEVVTIKDNIA